VTPGDWILVILTGVVLPTAGFGAGALVSKRHWKTVLRERWHQGLTTGRETASHELERLMWKRAKNIRSTIGSLNDHGAEYAEAWEDACTHLTHLVERLVDDDDGAL
jgi:hypothetical protein